jgi:vacuolar-type H+-ATPase subunit E/Vma4
MAEKRSDKSIIASEIEKLEQLRDELRVKAHLFKADAKAEFSELEKKLQKLRRDAAPVKRAAEKSATEVSDATKLLYDTVKDGFARIRKSLKSR